MYDFEYCMKHKCNDCKKQIECDNKEKKKGQEKVGEVNGKRKEFNAN